MGFATLPNQVHRKSVKKGFDFTLMVAGQFPAAMNVQTRQKTFVRTDSSFSSSFSLYISNIHLISTDVYVMDKPLEFISSNWLRGCGL